MKEIKLLRRGGAIIKGGTIFEGNTALTGYLFFQLSPTQFGIIPRLQHAVSKNKNTERLRFFKLINCRHCKQLFLNIRLIF